MLLPHEVRVGEVGKGSAHQRRSERSSSSGESTKQDQIWRAPNQQRIPSRRYRLVADHRATGVNVEQPAARIRADGTTAVVGHYPPPTPPLRFASGGEFLGGLERPAQLLDQVDYPVGVAPLVVIPGDDFDEPSVHYLGGGGVEDG